MLFPNYAQVSVAGSRGINEDTTFASPYGLVITDGATGLDALHLMKDYPNDVVWFSQNLTKLLAHYMSYELDIEDVFGAAVRELRTSYYDKIDNLRFTSSKFVLDKVQLPTAAVSIIRKQPNSNKLEVASVGDTTTLVVKNDNKISVVMDKTVPRQDAKAIKNLQALAKKDKISLFEARKKYSEVLKNNRAKQNSEGGYWIASLDSSFIPHLTKRTFPLSSVKEVISMTDGYWFGQEVLSKEPLTISEYADLVSRELSDIPNKILEKLNKDPKAVKYPRTKHCDDMSAVYGSFVTNKKETTSFI